MIVFTKKVAKNVSLLLNKLPSKVKVGQSFAAKNLHKSSKHTQDMQCKQIFYILSGLCLLAITIFALVYFLPSSSQNEIYGSVKLEIPQGQLQGRTYLKLHSRAPWVNSETKPVTVFYNIPFAQPPLGSKRFQPPDFQNLPSWDGLRDAQHRGNICYQYSGRYTDELDNSTYTESEDCLQLNVATSNIPSQYKSQTEIDHEKQDKYPNGYPVIVYIHGGSFYEGTGVAWRNEMNVISYENPIVSVTINYRLGSIGFAPIESEFNGKKSVGNFGLMDQFAALQWVQKNIQYFGGDPENVTIMGMSAGGMSVSSHYVWEDSMQMNKISKGILISDPFGAGVDTVERVENKFKKICLEFDCWDENLGQPDLACLQQIDPKILIAKNYVLDDIPGYLANFQLLKLLTGFQPIADGNVQPLEQRFNRIQKIRDAGNLPPTFFGVSKDEYYGLMVYPSNRSSCPVYRAYTNLNFGPEEGQAYTDYFRCDRSQEVPGEQEFAKIFDSYCFTCGQRNAFKVIFEI